MKDNRRPISPAYRSRLRGAPSSPSQSQINPLLTPNQFQKPRESSVMRPQQSQQQSHEYFAEEASPTAYTKKKKNNNNKFKIFLMLIVLLVVGAGAGYAYVKYFKPKPKVLSNSEAQDQPSSTTSNPSSKAVQPTGAASVRMIATGDMVPHSVINARAKKSDGSGYDYLQFMTNMKPVFDKSDIKFCNQATLAGGEKFGITGYPVFNSPLDFTHDMHALGCNLVTTGSNHTADKPQEVVNASVGEWDQYKDMLAVTGANRSVEEQKTVRTFTVKGLKFAFLAYTGYSNTPPPNAYMINTFDTALMTSQIADARSKSDVVIVSMRWGTEYSAGVNPDQDKWAQFVADQGADVVLGHGPHFIEPVKRLKGKDGRETLVFFSLGNFLNAQLEVEGLNSCIMAMDIDIATKKVAKASCLPINMHYEWTAAQKSAGDLLSRKNFGMFLMENAAEPLSKSLLNTTPDAQKERISKILNTYTAIPLITSADL